MATKECCRTCKHCVAGQSELFVLCRLRNIKVHPKIAAFAFCHHWMKSEPLLPKIDDSVKDAFIDRQLDFDKVLV